MNVNGLGDRIGRRHLALFGLAVLVVLAGCAGGTSDGTATPTNDTTTTPVTQTPVNGVDGTVALPENASIDGYTAGETLDSELTPAEELSVNGTQVQADTVAALAAVDTYSLRGESALTTRTRVVNQTQDISRVTRVDRGQSALASNQTVSFRGDSVTQGTYIANETLYQRSEQFVQQYNSEWIKQDISENFSDIFTNTDRLAFHERLLDNGTVTLQGTQAVDGTDTYRLRAETNSTTFADAFGISDTSDADVAMVVSFWVDTDSSTVVRAEGELEVVTTFRGQKTVVSESFVEQFDYGSVDVRLPEEAATAVEIGNESSAN